MGVRIRLMNYSFKISNPGIAWQVLLCYHSVQGLLSNQLVRALFCVSWCGAWLARGPKVRRDGVRGPVPGLSRHGAPRAAEVLFSDLNE